jgi:ABC-type transporter Mla subunit MlaD
VKRVLGALGLVVAVTALVLFGTGADRDSDDAYLVRAIFDNAAFVIAGEDVKVAGVKVGTIDSLDITKDDKAAVVLRIDDPGYRDFRADARCSVRPQSLIGEKFVECQPTQRRAADAPLPPPLREIERGAGKGQRLLPVERTSQSVDLDLLNNVMRLPYRQRFSIIINELGTGLAGRGDDLREVVRRADPALREVDEVLEILADQNRTLVSLAEDSDRALAPLARDRKRVTGFIESSADVAQATAERREDLEADVELLPRFLAQLTPTMGRLGEFADAARPVLADLGARAPQVNRVISELGPFSRAGIGAFDTLGEATRVGRPALRESRPIVRDLRNLARQAKPAGSDLADILDSFEETEGIERLMDLFYYQAAATNGFDEFGHYLRARLLVNNCSDYKTQPIGGCTSKFREPESEAQVASASRATSAARKATAPAAKAPARPAPRAARPAPSVEQQAQDGMLDYLFGEPAK